jgi:hypothetical protein
MVEAMLEMRRSNQEYNDKDGYDVIKLPVAPYKTRVFTIKEFRISKSGGVLTSSYNKSDKKPAPKPVAGSASARSSGIIGGGRRGGKHAQVKRDSTRMKPTHSGAESLTRQSVMDEYVARDNGGSSGSNWTH